MGQQQLLLVILVTIIVGIATVVAINTFSAAADSANVDAARQDALSIAAAAQQFFMKPAALGGGAQDFSGMTFEDISGVPVEIASTGDGSNAFNENGTYILGSGSTTEISITAHPASCENYDEGTGGCTDPLTGTIKENALSWTN